MLDNAVHFLIYLYHDKNNKEKRIIRQRLPSRDIIVHTPYPIKGDVMIDNGLLGVHLATSQEVEIPLSAREMQLVHAGGNHQWNVMCESVKARTGIEIINQIQLNYLVVNGNKSVFH